jgi:WD40 repeat protein
LEDPGASFIYRGHASITTVAKFSPNGYWVASADVSGKVRVWSWDSPEHLLKMESSVFAAKISDLDWDMESKRLVIAGDGSGIIVRCITWDTANNLGMMMMIVDDDHDDNNVVGYCQQSSSR